MRFTCSVVWAILFLSLTAGCQEKQKKNEINEFDMVCQYFEELRNLKNFSIMSGSERNNFILDRLNLNMAESSAAASWRAVSSAVSEERYYIFQSGAESVLGESWECQAMKDIMPITAEK